MPENTLAGWENKIRSYAATHRLPLDRTVVRRAAKKINRNFEACNALTLTDDELIARVLQHSDPTGEEAVKNVMRERNHAAAARRLAA
ncbi:hypothetical protein SAMN04487912_102402 [Arthrobacter sp. cf158]|uniref:hypothetical protein n=1 Tax=Arthrobacter sp. cf158 TaxID=1761744 RepID=UPI00089A55C1|nr:hypothetical protein [Arthrobacter sp. cf158]SDW34325.1 hypothetical protein SAMN04487912_102402 [Arthrobacter sp. cf158]